MLKNKIVVIAVVASLSPTATLAEHETSAGNGGIPFSKENIGKAVGAAAGALLGSQIGDGRGQLAAVAVGTLAGYWVGGRVGRHLSQQDRAGIAHTTRDALETGNTQTWRNPDTGVATRVSVRDAETPSRSRGQRALTQAPTLELINRYYAADGRVNVRGGPGTDYEILYQVAENERVPVIGRVTGEQWLMLANHGQGNGFVYAPLFTRVDGPENAIRDASRSGDTFETYAVDHRECRAITQEVVLPDNTSRTHEFRACRQPDGSWTEV